MASGWTGELQMKSTKRRRSLALGPTRSVLLKTPCNRAGSVKRELVSWLTQDYDMTNVVGWRQRRTGVEDDGVLMALVETQRRSHLLQPRRSS